MHLGVFACRAVAQRRLVVQLADPRLLSLVRLCSVWEMVALALGALAGAFHRFAEPRKRVKDIGRNPAFDDRGQGQGSGGLAGPGRKALRGLLIEAAQAVLRCSQTPLAQWGKKLLRRKGSVNPVVGARARKLAVAVWFLMMGCWTPWKQIDDHLAIKVAKIFTPAGKQGLKKLGKSRKAFGAEIYDSLKAGRVYLPDPNKKFAPAG